MRNKHMVIAKSLVNISHLESVLAYVFWLCERNTTVSLYVTFNKAGWKENILQYEIFEKYWLPSNFKVVDTEYDVMRSSAPISICNFGFISARNWLESKKYKHFKQFVQFDEGSGSWQNFFSLVKIGMAEKRSRGESSVRYLLKKILSRVVGMMVFSKTEDWRWVKHGKINPLLNSYLPKVYASKKTDKEIPFYENETWIILTSPFVESSFIDTATYVEWVEKLIETIRGKDKTNKHILLKCHPAEDRSKYNDLALVAEILDMSESIESLMWQEKYHHYNVVGEYSTSLVTLQLLYGIKTFFVKSLVHREITGNFKKLFEKHVKKLEMRCK